MSKKDDKPPKRKLGTGRTLSRAASPGPLSNMALVGGLVLGAVVAFYLISKGK